VGRVVAQTRDPFSRRRASPPERGADERVGRRRTPDRPKKQHTSFGPRPLPRDARGPGSCRASPRAFPRPFARGCSRHAPASNRLRFDD
jgi:hypothetical protein